MMKPIRAVSLDYFLSNFRLTSDANTRNFYASGFRARESGGAIIGIAPRDVTPPVRTVLAELKILKCSLTGQLALYVKLTCSLDWNVDNSRKLRGQNN